MKLRLLLATMLVVASAGFENIEAYNQLQLSSKLTELEISVNEISRALLNAPDSEATKVGCDTAEMLKSLLSLLREKLSKEGYTKETARIEHLIRKLETVISTARR